MTPCCFFALPPMCSCVLSCMHPADRTMQTTQMGSTLPVRSASCITPSSAQLLKQKDLARPDIEGPPLLVARTACSPLTSRAAAPLPFLNPASPAGAP